MVPRLLRGDETWCQGFSEPGTGSNLASLSCRAVRDDDGWRVSGQKVWTSLAQFAQRCVLLTRTGTPESAHRGITALFVDMDTPGITVRPIETMHGALEFCEVFFDDVVVPFDRTLGEEGQGWSVAMDLLPYERSTALWHRAAYLHRRLQQLLESAPPGALDPAEVGEVTQLLYAFRARSRATQHRLAAGEHLGAETSIDKVLLATAEQAVFDLVDRGAGRRGDARRRPGRASAGGPSTSTRGRRRSTAGAPRSSATSSPAASSTSGTTADGPRRPRAVRAEPPRRPPRRTPATTSTARSPSSAGRDALADEPQAAVSLLFGLQGAANATSSALDHVLAHGLGRAAGAPPAVVLPALGAVAAAGTAATAGGSWSTGSAPPASADADTVLVVARDGDKDVAVRRSAGDLDAADGRRRRPVARARAR